MMYAKEKVSLHEVLRNLDRSGMGDVSGWKAIREWVRLNGNQVEAVDVLRDIAVDTIRERTQSLFNARMWMFSLPEFDEDCVSPRTADAPDMLYMLQQACALGIDIRSNYTTLYNWAKENIPNLTLNTDHFFQLLIPYLAKMGIFFRNYPKEKVESKFNFPTMHPEFLDRVTDQR